MRHKLRESGGGISTLAMAAIDIGLWDREARIAGLSLTDLIGRQRETTAVYGSGVNRHLALDELSEQVHRWVEAGHTAVKIKVGQPSLDEDVERVATVRRIIGPHRLLMIDANQLWDLPTARRAARVLSPFDIFWLEEPLRPDDYDGYRKLAEATEVRIAAGEEESSRLAYLELMDRGRIDVVQVDLTRCGGFTEAMKIAALAWDRGLPVANHGFTTYINVTAALHWLNSIPNTLICEFVAEEETNLRESITRQKLRARDGYLEIPQEPGLGIDVDWDAIAKFRV